MNGKKLALRMLDDFDNDFDNDFIAIFSKFNENDIHDLEILYSLLKKIGIKVQVTRFETTDMLSFAINYSVYNKATKRRAGRKKDRTMADRYKKCTVAELKAKLKTMKKKEIIAELGCPDMTFYRILKNVDFEAEDASIWNFTS